MSSKAEPATIAGEEVRLEIGPDDIDIKERDPDEINQHLRVTFQEIFAEPHITIYSFDKVWIYAFQVFNVVKLWTYRIMTLICGLPCACCWAVYFGCLSFCNIWVWVPWLKAWFINMLCVRKVFEPWMETFVGPCYAAAGRIFSAIRVTIIKDTGH